MEKDFGSWFQHQHPDRKLPYLNSIGAKINLGRQNTLPICMRPCSDTVPFYGTTHVFGFSGTPKARARQPNEASTWFYALPNFHRTSAPVLNSGSKEKPSESLNYNCAGLKAPNGENNSAKRRFLVFDQCGDHTTLIFSSGIGAPVHCPTSCTLKLPGAFDLNKNAPDTKKDVINPSEYLVIDRYNDIYGDDVLSEMREDTGELNALLYSDYESDYSDEDEEASTGHSPSTMTAYDKSEWSEESGEEVASSALPSKRQKLSDGVYDVPLFENTAKSVKLNSFFELEDAESSCGNVNNNLVKEELSSLSSKKRSRKDKVHEAVSILRSIIPSGEGKDAIGVLDEAIHYLKSMRHKAKALGFNAL